MKTVDPKIGQAFAEWSLEQNHAKAHAAATTFRFSSVMGCSRQAGYVAAQVPETDPMDGSSLAVAAMGSLLHEDIQTAVAKRWPGATFEGTGQLEDLISGHFDIDLSDDDEIVELKTVGAYKFDLAIGLFRSPGRGQPAKMRSDGGKGPSLAHICQGGFNALAHGRKTVRIAYVSREAVSVKKAEEAGLGPIERFWAEWTFDQEVWGPLVEAEIARLAKIRALVATGVLPDRADFDDAGKQVKVDPDKGHWRCSYCSHAQRCKLDGPGRIAVELSGTRVLR
jgi:hypothetical protein